MNYHTNQVKYELLKLCGRQLLLDIITCTNSPSRKILQQQFWLDLWINVLNRNHPKDKLSISQPNTLKQKAIIIPLENKCELLYARPEHGMYKNMKRPISAETPPTYTKEYTPYNPQFIIENDDKTLTYVLDQIPKHLVSNLINFLYSSDQKQIPLEVKIALQEDNLNTPAQITEITDEENSNFVDLSINSCLTINSIGTTPAVENVCSIEIEDILQEFRLFHNYLN